MATKTDADGVATLADRSGAGVSGLTLETDRGITTISDDVVAKLAGRAVREVEGVVSMGKSFRRLMSRVRPGEEALAQGVNVEVGKKECAIDVVVVVQYGVSIPALAQAVRENVITRIESGTGLIVKEVNIEVDDLQFESDAPSENRVE